MKLLWSGITRKSSLLCAVHKNLIYSSFNVRKHVDGDVISVGGMLLAKIRGNL